MRLVCNLSMLGDKPTGLGVYAKKCLSYLASRYDLDLVASGDRTYPGNLLIESPSGVAIGGGIRAAVMRHRWASSVTLPDDSVVYSPTHHGFSGARRQILTIHDLICLRFPSQHWPQYAFFRFVMPKILRNTEAVFVVSETTKMDVAQTYRYPLDRIFVVPNAVDREEFADDKPLPNGVGDSPFLLMVGARYHHKNVDEILDVHDEWSKSYRLVVVSCSGKYRSRLERKVNRLGLGSKVFFMDYVSFDDLVGLYQHAAALIYPSKWEGFGIPPLEALASGCRVVLSDIPVHREVFEGAATFVRLGERADWHRAIGSLGDSQSEDTKDAIESVLAKYSSSNTGQALVRALLTVEPRISQLANGLA